MNRVAVFGSRSGYGLWAESIDAIDGWECIPVIHEGASALVPVPPSAVGRLRAAAGRADVILALSTFDGLVATLGARGRPVLAIDVGAARWAEHRPGRERRLIGVGLRGLSGLIGLTDAQVTALSMLGRWPTFLVRQPVQPVAFPWRPDTYTPYLFCAGSSGRDLALLAEVARSVPVEVRLVEGGREMVPANGRPIPSVLPPNLVRYGAVGRGTYSGLLAGAGLLVHPLAPSVAPVGITVMLDAMAAGVPIVGTDVPSVREYQDGAEGSALLVPPDAPEAMGAAVRRILADQALAATLSTAAVRQAAAIASPRVVASQLRRALEGTRCAS